MTSILLIDDDERLSAPLAEYFKRFKMDLTSATHPKDGLALLKAEVFDLVILDVMLPDQDGFDVCKTIRRSSDIPIVMLTARGEVMDRVVGLELGADDYLAKPFEPRELVVRIQNILKRSEGVSSSKQTLEFVNLVIDKPTQAVSVGGENVSLTSNEYELLLLLASSPGKKFSRDDILNHLKGRDVELFSRAVDIQISRLRQKLKPTDYIKTVWGAGYSFSAAEQN
ncbi:MAG: response regulator transcription factor [Pseudomonadota bacterium]